MRRIAALHVAAVMVAMATVENEQKSCRPEPPGTPKPRPFQGDPPSDPIDVRNLKLDLLARRRDNHKRKLIP